MSILNKLYEEFENEIVDEFLEHLDIITDSLEIIITNLSEDNYEESINELFRIFHNLKSATAYLHLKRINIFSQLVEDILEVARKRESFNEDFRDWLYLTAEQLEIWQSNINGNGELSPINPKILDIPEGY